MGETEEMTESPEAPTQTEVEESAPDGPDLTPDEGENGDESGEDEQGADEPETPAEDRPPASSLSEQEIEERYRKLELESKRHTKRISEIMGDDAPDLIVCPFCEPEMQGFLRMESLDQPRDDIHAAMTEVLRKPAQVAYREAPHARGCNACDGLGNVLSGSRVPGNEVITCPTCQGRGYLAEATTITNGMHTDPAAVVPALVGPSGAVIEDTDVFGSPRLLADGMENPNYGKTLQYKDPQIESEYLRRLTGS